MSIVIRKYFHWDSQLFEHSQETLLRCYQCGVWWLPRPLGTVATKGEEKGPPTLPVQESTSFIVSPS